MDLDSPGIASNAGVTGVLGTFALGVFFIALVIARIRWAARLNVMTRLERDVEWIFVKRLLLSNLAVSAGSFIALSLAFVGTFQTLLVIMGAFAVFTVGNILILIQFRHDLARADSQ